MANRFLRERDRLAMIEKRRRISNSMTKAILKPFTMTPEEAKKQGFTIDTTCYPNIAYKGSRFEPHEWFMVHTEIETTLLTTLEKIEGIAYNEELSLSELRDMIQRETKNFITQRGTKNGEVQKKI